MCGIAGILPLSDLSADKILFDSNAMSFAIKHRGPDDDGIFLDPNNKISLIFRRLSIVDLNATGHQPLFSKNKRFVMIFNGEIYNHKELRNELNIYHKLLFNTAINWDGYSDSETLIVAFQIWDIETVLNKLIGMFAIALWDNEKDYLYLIRDRMGEKPLYYGWIGDGDNKNFVFASELKAIKTHPEFRNNISKNAVFEYLKFNYIPAPLSIYESIFKLEPGCLLIIKDKPPLLNPQQPINFNTSYRNITLIKWWDLTKKFDYENFKIKDTSEKLNILENKLIQSIKLQKESEVPIGAFLSGGIDSSLVVSLAQSLSSNKINTFTAGVLNSNVNENTFAQGISDYLGTNHTNFIFSTNDAIDIIKNIPNVYDEPFADSSQIPSLLLSKFVSKKVKVVLTGDGGDELFGGYQRYEKSIIYWNILNKIPYDFRKLIGNFNVYLSKTDFSRIIFNNKIIVKINKFGNKLISIQNKKDLSNEMKYVNKNNNIINKNYILNNFEKLNIIQNSSTHISTDNHLKYMMYEDIVSYLPDDILCKVDRATMAFSLESRIPLLDHRVVEYAWNLPNEMKINKNISKWALKEILYKYIPKDLMDRPKSGFSIPLHLWLKGPLKNWAESLLNKSLIDKEGFFDSDSISSLWYNHINNIEDNSSLLWNILMFQLWLQENK